MGDEAIENIHNRLVKICHHKYDIRYSSLLLFSLNINGESSFPIKLYIGCQTVIRHYME